MLIDDLFIDTQTDRIKAITFFTENFGDEVLLKELLYAFTCGDKILQIHTVDGSEPIRTFHPTRGTTFEDESN